MNSSGTKLDYLPNLDSEGEVVCRDTGRTTQQNVLLTHEIATGGQIAQLFLRQFRVERPVEVFEGLVAILEMSLTAEPATKSRG